MSENKIKFPAKLASNNPKSFGIVDATEISGHRSVETLSDLYTISDPVLSILKDGSDAIGQEWFVVSEDCKYRLDNWGNRRSVAGWTKLPKQEFVNTKQSISEKDQPNGYAGLDSNGKLPIEKTYGATATVVDVATYKSLPVTGSSGVIYYVSNTSAQYKWSGSAYIDITDGADNAKKNETSIFDCSNGTSTKYYSSLSAAINVVPPVYRTSNRIISYLSTENSTTSAVNYQYHGIDSTTWTNLTKWERVPNQADLAEIRSDLNEIQYNTFNEKRFLEFKAPDAYLDINIPIEAGMYRLDLISYSGTNLMSFYIKGRRADNTEVKLSTSIRSVGAYSVFTSTERFESLRFVLLSTDNYTVKVGYMLYAIDVRKSNDCILKGGVNLPNIDTAAGTISFDSDSSFYINGISYSLSSSIYKNIPIKSNGSTNLLVFNINTKILESKVYDYSFTSTDVLIGSFKTNFGNSYSQFVNASFPFEFTIDKVSSKCYAERLKVAELEISDLSKNVNSVISDGDIIFIDGYNINISYGVGEIVPLEPYAISSYRYSIVNCKEKDLFTISVTGGNNPRAWAFLDINNRLLSVAPPFSAILSMKLIAPINAAKLVLNDKKTGLINKRMSQTSKLEERLNVVESKGYYELIEQTNNLIEMVGWSYFVNKKINIVYPDRYSSWPFIGKVNNKLICVYTRGLVHEDDNKGAIFSRISSNGIIWTPIRNIIDTNNVRDGVTGKGNDSDGNMIIWNRVGVPGGSSTFYQLYKTVDGLEFEIVSSPVFDTKMGHAGDIINVPSVGLMSFYNTYGSSRSWGVVTSGDNGVTWTQSNIEIDLPIPECPVEISAAYLGDGKIIAIGRCDAAATEGQTSLWQMESIDYGATWVKTSTNLYNGVANTPSVIYNQSTDELTLYCYIRQTGELQQRETLSSSVFGNPTNWPNYTVIASGGLGQDAGNVNSIEYNGKHIVVYYSGNPTDTGIYGLIVN